MGLTGQNAFYTACAYLHGPVFVFGGAISVSLRWTAGSGTNPLSLAALDSSFPFLSPIGDIFPRPGEVFRRESPWQNRQVSSSFVNGMKKPAVKL